MKIYVKGLEIDEEALEILEVVGHKLVYDPDGCDIALLTSPEVEEVKRHVAAERQVVALETRISGSTQRMRDWFRAGAADVRDYPFIPGITPGTELGHQLLKILREL